jgi:hypothetical protein
MNALTDRQNSASAAARIPKPIPEIPKLPKGKKMLETVVEKNVDSLFRSAMPRQHEPECRNKFRKALPTCLEQQDLKTTTF